MIYAIFKIWQYINSFTGPIKQVIYMIIPGEVIAKGHAQMFVRFHLFYNGIVEHSGL